MSRLPTPGSDDGNWGDILNDFLLQAHNADGTLQTQSKTLVGLGNVDNTSDANKNSATATLSNKTLTSPVITKVSNLTANGVVMTSGGDGTLGVSTLPQDSTVYLDGFGNYTAPQIAESQVTNLTTDLGGKIPKSQVTAKGDILAATASATVTNVAVGANGTALAADSSAASGLSYQQVQMVPSVTLASGDYWFPISPTATTTSNFLTNNTLRVSPFYVGETRTISRIGAEVTAIGDVGCTLRLVVYATTAGKPGALMVDAGTIDGHTVAVQEITLGSTLTLVPGWYWVGAAVQGAPTTQPTIRCLSSVVPPSGFPLVASNGSAPGANATILGYSQSSVSGAAPNPMVPAGSAGFAPRLFFRAA